MTARLTYSSCFEQRGIFRFLLPEDVKPCKILSSFYTWVKAFKDGRESTTDDWRSGRPVDVSTPESVQDVKDIFKSDSRVTKDEMVTKLDISMAQFAIVPEKLHFSKVSCR